jgi:hypothetical protein
LLKSFSRSRKRKHSSDDDAKSTFVDQVTPLDELRTARFNDEECSSHAERSRFLGRHRAHNAGKNAAAAQDAPGPLLRFPVDGVEHHIHIFHFFLETLVSVINRFRGAELAEEIVVLG